MSYLKERDALLKRMAEERAAKLVEADRERERNHLAWLKLCGMMAPIGKLR